MKAIEFFIKKTMYSVVPDFFSVISDDQSCMYRPPIESLHKQIKELGVDAGVSLLDIQDLPTSTDAFLICILDQNSLIPDDYLARILAMNNLHRNASMFCGPVATKSNVKIKSDDILKSSIFGMYKSFYYESYTNFISCQLNGDYNNYPCINGCIISGRAYNACNGYKCKVTPRTILEDNFDFFKMMDTHGPMIYNVRLATKYFITPEESNTDVCTRYFYNLGYKDAQIERGDIRRHKYLSNAKLLDIELKINNSDLDESQKYILHASKCMYDVGYHECLANGSIL